MVVEVLLDGRRLLCDPGFGMSLLRPIPLQDQAQDEHPPGGATGYATRPEGGRWTGGGRAAGRSRTPPTSWR